MKGYAVDLYRSKLGTRAGKNLRFLKEILGF